MSAFFIQLLLFASKTFVVFLFIIGILIAFLTLVGKGKSQPRLSIKNLNEKAAINTELLLTEISPKQLKKWLKQKKSEKKKAAKSDQNSKRIYVLDFNGDIKASAVETLREEVSALLHIATPQDEIVVRLESAGGMVPNYGLAASQLMRIRAQGIPLVISIDKVAASGGYLMACVANNILAAPFAIIGSIGVVVQLPNFHRYLQNKQIDFEQHTAGEFKRTISVFGENTQEGRDKLQHEINDIHQLFKNLITQYRQQVDINQVATGEYWLGEQALTLKLVDHIRTSDDYLFEQAKTAAVFAVSYATKKPLMSKLLAGAKGLVRQLV